MLVENCGDHGGIELFDDKRIRDRANLSNIRETF